MRGMNSHLMVLTISLFGLIAGTVLLAVAVTRSMIAGVAVAVIALLFSCYGIAVTFYPLLAR